MPTLERDTQRCSMQPDTDKQQCLKDRSPGDDKDRPLDDDDETMAAWLELLLGDKDDDGFANLLWFHGYSMLKVSQSLAGAGKTGDVPAPERTKTEEGDDEDEEEEPTGKRGKKVKGDSASTKSAFAHLAKKLGKTVEAPKESVAVDEENHPNLVNSPQRKVLRMRPKCLDASSDEDDEPAGPMRRRRAVHGMDDEEDED